MDNFRSCYLADYLRAFVAGLHAGHIFNNFPKMDDDWISSSVSLHCKKTESQPCLMPYLWYSLFTGMWPM